MGSGIILDTCYKCQEFVHETDDWVLLDAGGFVHKVCDIKIINIYHKCMEDEDETRL